MLKVCPRISPQVLAFNGSENNEATGTRRTHAGLKVGLAAGTAHLALGTYLNWHALKSAGIGKRLGFLSKVGVTVGCGALVDAMINNKFKKGEDNNSIGKKFGPLIGAGVGVVASIITHGKEAFSKAGLKAMPLVTLLFAAGGFGLGAITDHFANKERH